jgi:ATP-dependent Lon protease
MKESIVTGLSWIRTNMWKLGLVVQPQVKVVKTGEEKEDLGDQLLKKFDLHVHFPAASVPKDGPSAGVTITVALVSLFTGRRVKSDFAMTGELSLQGLVLPVGGIKEKCMAAHRNKIRNVILPVKNREDTKEIPQDVKQELIIHFVEKIEDALTLALEDNKDPSLQKQEVMPFFREKL